MIALAGLGVAVAGFLLAVGGLMTMDSGPDWFTAPAAVLGYVMLFGGVAVLLVGAGLWLAHPHVWRF